eukprot:TRINITY_DN1333_c0_g3_i1.p1 TRINITY_DN1333_c0_g3~~TRINITY_DN1333_c0_g3_i1.p1  ORF type:complete len:621 (+),score=114.63 TRINITY_DN1333_c0_g3_i1:66-1928(+)
MENPRPDPQALMLAARERPGSDGSRAGADSAHRQQADDLPRRTSHDSTQASFISISSARVRTCHGNLFPFGCPCIDKKVQDWYHLVLLLGITASILALALQVLDFANDDCGCEYCWNQVASFLCILPSLYEFTRFLQTYNESLHKRRQDAAKADKELMEEINTQKTIIENQRSRFAGKAFGFANGLFGKERDNFLLMMRTHNQELFQDSGLMQEFRVFTLKWIYAYSHSVLDPRDLLYQTLEQDLNKCITMEELRKFLTNHLDKTRGLSSILPTTSIPATGYLLNAPDEVENDDSFKTCSWSWVTLKCHMKFGRNVERTFDREFDREWPMTYNFCFGSITVLSRRHFYQLLYLTIDIVLILLDLFAHLKVTLELTIANLICVISTLALFEQIDEIAKLEKETDLKKAKKSELQAQYDKEKKVWEQVETRFDLWDHRTNPYLGIMSQMHKTLQKEGDRIKDGNKSLSCDLKTYLHLANQRLEYIDDQLGSIKDWEGGDDPGWKAAFGRQLNDVAAFAGEEIVLNNNIMDKVKARDPVSGAAPHKLILKDDNRLEELRDKIEEKEAAVQGFTNKGKHDKARAAQTELNDLRKQLAQAESVGPQRARADSQDGGAGLARSSQG